MPWILWCWNLVNLAEIHQKSISDKVGDRREAVDQLRTNFAVLPDKDAAWQDLVRLNSDKNHEVRLRAAEALGASFSTVPDKDAAWQDLHRLTCDWDISVRRVTAEALGAAFSTVPDKDAAWQDLVRLTGDKNHEVRSRAAEALRVAFSTVPDKDAAWQYLHRLTGDEDSDIRWWAAEALRATFSTVPDKDTAWQDLVRLTGDKNHEVRSRAAEALRVAFSTVPDKDTAWKDLVRLTSDENSDVRWRAAAALGVAFSTVPDKDAAWQYLHRLTSDEDRDVLWWAAEALGAAFSTVPDKDTAWKDLVRLTSDENNDVRVLANHSLGRASIFKATEAEGEEDFRRELKTALQYFERSAAESKYSNPAKFCLPFYRSFYVLTCESERSEAEIEKYLREAKDASEGSKSKEDLLEAVENLSNALKEAQRLKGKNLYDLKRDLKVYSQYCNRFAELMEDTEDKAPRTVKLLRIGGRQVDTQIKETIAEIQEIAKELCQMTVGTNVEPSGREVSQKAREISIENYQRSEKSIHRIAEILEEMCDLLPPQKRDHAFELVKEIENCCNLEDRILRLEAAINYIQPKIDIERYGKQFEYIKYELDEIKLGIKELQQKILDRLDENEKAIISTILDQSDQEQMDEMLDLVKQVLSAIQHREPRGPVTSDDLNHLSKVVDDTRLKAADKLKITLPLIPYLLQYEHEITLEKGVSLSVAWSRLVGWAKGKK